MRCKRVLGPIAIASLVVAVAQPTLACRCLPPIPALEQLGRSAAVFSGVVVHVEGGCGLSNLVSFDVIDCWKGGLSSTVVVTTASSSAACGVDFVVGSEYLVYALGSDALTTNSCTRTRLLALAADDIDELGPPTCAPTAVEPGTWGRVKKLYSD